MSLDERMRIQRDDKLAEINLAIYAIGGLIDIVAHSEAYREGYAYASVAMVWARKERDRLIRVLNGTEVS